MAANRMIITISRQEGSGGREIAQRLAKSLKFSYVDNQIIKLAAQQLGISEEELTELDNGLLSKVEDLRELVTQPMGSGAAGEDDTPTALSPAVERPAGWVDHQTRLQDYHNLIDSLIKDVARHGNAVILGRGANLALKGLPGVVNIFIHAPLKERIERLAYLERITPAEAARRIERIDAQRAAYVRRFYGVDWPSPDNYHLIINTSEISLATAAEMVCQFVKTFTQHKDVINPLAIHRSYDTLIDKPDYTVQEASELFMVSPYLLRHAVRQGKLKGKIIDHHVVSISREALLNWMRGS